MQSKRPFAQDLLRIAMALSILLYPVLANAQAPAAKAVPADAVVAAQNGDAATVPPPNGKLPKTTKAVVHLQVDGNLKGQLVVLDAAGKPTPAQGKVSFLQNGQVVAAAQTDSNGVFQVPGLKPGVYSVLASGPEGFAAMTVQVSPYAADAPAAQLTLEMTLVPLDQADALSALLAQTPPDPPGPVCEPACYGGGGGYGGGGYGGGGLGGLGMIGAALGALGMGFGIAGLAEENASPHTF